VAFASAFLLFAATLPAGAAEPAAPHLTAAPVKRELAAVIEAQLAAFRANDYPKAYTFAATEIQGLFPVAQFETMVKQAYPVIAQSKTATFGLAFDTGDEAVVTVRVENASKTSVEYQYLLKKQNGAWKITGVSETKAGSLQV
jgi:ABC-type transporter MlaC component